MINVKVPDRAIKKGPKDLRRNVLWTDQTHLVGPAPSSDRTDFTPADIYGGGGTTIWICFVAVGPEDAAVSELTLNSSPGSGVRPSNCRRIISNLLYKERNQGFLITQPKFSDLTWNEQKSANLCDGQVCDHSLLFYFTLIIIVCSCQLKINLFGKDGIFTEMFINVQTH